MTNPFDDLRAFSADLERSVSPERARFAVAGAVDPQPGRSRRAVVALATAGLLVVSNGAFAAAANPAVPDDALYGVDRAYETVQNLAGFNSHAAERLSEAAVMADRGRASEVLSLVQEALTEVLDSSDPSAAVEALKRKANLDEGFENELAAVVYAAQLEAQPGDNYGEAVSDLAKQLGKGKASAPGQNRNDS